MPARTFGAGAAAAAFGAGFTGSGFSGFWAADLPRMFFAQKKQKEWFATFYRYSIIEQPSESQIVAAHSFQQLIGFSRRALGNFLRAGLA